MRMQRTNSPRRTRRAFTTTATCVAVGGLMLATSGTAAASTVLADDCSTDAHGASGNPIAIRGSSLTEAVKAGAEQAKDDLGHWRISIHPSDLANYIDSLGSIEFGKVADQQRTNVSGGEIGQKVKGLLDDKYPTVLPPLGVKRGEVLDHIRDSVTDQCGLSVVATDHNTSSKSAKSAGSSGNAGSSSKSTTDGDSAGQGTSKTKQGSGDTKAPRRDYSGIPSASAPSVKKGGSSANMGDPSKMDAPPKASLPHNRLPSGQGGDAKQGANAGHSKVANAGKADALNEQPGPERVQVPMLLAVVALALATAGLVRSWVLRRT